MTTENRIRASFIEQAEYCGKLGSSFMRELLTGLAHHIDTSTETGKRILEWPGEPEPKADALALRLAGALHALARNGLDPELTAFYMEPEHSSESKFLPTVMAAIKKHDTNLLPWLDNAPQTNEVARATAIYAGLSVISDRYGLPISLHEMGCSGGLNLQCAQFGYRFGGRTFGDTNSRLQLEPAWKGTLPPKSDVKVVSRQGCDLNPLSVNNADDAEKLVAYLWPDQPDRIARVEAAIEIAKADPPTLERADAAGWVEKKFRADDNQNAVRVLVDTIAWNYFPQPVKNRITTHLETVGAQTSQHHPIAWLTFEFDDDDLGPFLKVRTWPGNNEAEILASADPHVHEISWHDIK